MITGKRNYPVKEWIEKAKRGLSAITIGEEYGVSGTTVRYYFKKNDYSPHTWPRPPLSEIDRAWIAAIIDCDGTLLLHVPPNKKTGKRAVQICGRVQMTTRGVPEKLYRLCGGCIIEKDRREENYKIPYLWSLASNGLRWLLPQILPYLIVKRRRAEILLEVLSKNWRGHRMDKYEFARLYNEMRSLNQRGIQPYIPSDEIIENW